MPGLRGGGAVEAWQFRECYGLFAGALIVPSTIAVMPPEAMIGAPAIMAARAFVPIAAIGAPAEVAAPAMVPVIAAAAARSPAVMAPPAAMPAIFVAACFDNGRAYCGGLDRRYARGMGN